MKNYIPQETYQKEQWLQDSDHLQQVLYIWEVYLDHLLIQFMQDKVMEYSI